MVTLFRFIARTGGIVDPSQDLRLELAEIRIGRAEDCPLRLVREGVRFNHAVLTPTEAGVSLSAMAGAELEKSGRMAASVVLSKPGDQVRIGPYLLTLVWPEPAHMADRVVTVRLDEQKPFDEIARAEEYLQHFAVALPNIRLWSFCLAVSLFLLCFLLPLVFAPHEGIRGKASMMTFPWAVGEMSRGHASFGSKCDTCHEKPFVPVASSACLNCHQGVGQHADPHMASVADLTNRRCESCHHEHKGEELATRDDSASCVACHGNIARIAPASKLGNVHNFSVDHPQFKPALVQDPARHLTAKFSLDDKSAVDHSNLRFTHATHLKLDKLQNGNSGNVCGTCHEPAPGGVIFMPLSFERMCADCHKLQFEPKHPEWQLPHGHPAEVVSRISGYYAQAAMAGEVFPPPRSDLFAKPGAPLPAPAPVGSAMVSTQTAAAMMSSIARSACGQCHVTTPPPPGASDIAWKVEPVFVPDRYMTRSVFRHDKHATVDCQTCHAAKSSDGGPTALLPGIATCRTCHSDPDTAGRHVPSPCISCHTFHVATLPIRTSHVSKESE